MNHELQIELGRLKMRKILIIALGLASLATLAAVHQASAAQECRHVCDQLEMDRGQWRCFAGHYVCTKPGPGRPQPVNDQKLKRQN